MGGVRQRPKNPVSALALLTGNFLRVWYKRAHFCFNTVRTVLILSGRFQYCLDSFNSVWTISIVSKQFQYCPDYFNVYTLPYCEEQWNSLMLSLTRTLDYLCSSYHLDFCGDHHFISCPDFKMTKVHVWDWTNLMRIQTTFQTSLSLRQFHLGLLFCASLPSPAPPAPLAPVTSRSTNNSKKNLVRLGKKSVKPRSTNYNKITWSASVRMISPQGSPCCTCQ